MRRVGGSASNLGVALNASAPIFDTLSPDASLGEMIDIADRAVGFKRSAHRGGCGGANGEMEDNEAIAGTPSILAATETFVGIPEVAQYLGTSFDEALAEEVRSNAAATAQLQKDKGWDGQTYVDGVVAENPNGVEELAVDHDDHVFHGHRESRLIVIIGDATFADKDAFVWNLKATKLAAQRLAQGDANAYARLVIADCAKHLAVANRLPSRRTPVELLFV